MLRYAARDADKPSAELPADFDQQLEAMGLRELISGGTPSEEFFVRLGDAKEPLTGATGPWKLIREWVTFLNVGKEPIRIVEPGFLNLAARPGDPAPLDFHWMTGGENRPGSWTLKTEKLDPAKPRSFDSYEPFPGAPPGFPGDGINAKVLLNGRQVWPDKGWLYVANGSVTVPFDFPLEVGIDNNWVSYYEVLRDGRRLLWFSKLGANGGKAAVSVDGAPAEVVDTYSADDVWGVCVYRREFPTAGRHRLLITVLGQHGPRAKLSLVAVDGFRIEP